MLTELRGQKVHLRPKRLGDAVRDYAWSQDGELAALEAAYPVAITFSSYLRLYTLEIEHPPSGSYHFAIETEPGEHIGNTMLFQIDQGRSEAEMGILIGECSFWNRGYGTEAVCLLLQFAFTALGLERVHLRTLSSNQRAQRCFKKAGFLPSGREHSGGGGDFLIMEIDRQRWEELLLKEGAPSPGEGAPSELSSLP